MTKEQIEQDFENFIQSRKRTAKSKLTWKKLLLNELGLVKDKYSNRIGCTMTQAELNAPINEKSDHDPEDTPGFMLWTLDRAYFSKWDRAADGWTPCYYVDSVPIHPDPKSVRKIKR